MNLHDVIAQMAQDGIARTIYPAHTMFDGDTIFALALGGESSGPKIDVNIIGAFAAKVCSQAIIEGVKSARSAGGLPAAWSGENQ